MLNTIPSEFTLIDQRFARLDGDFVVQRLHTGARKSEGPVYFPAGRYLVWSDIPNERLLRWDESTGAVSVFRSPAGHINGNTLDREGRLISCEQGNRRVTRTEPDGRITVLAERYDARHGSTWLIRPDQHIAGRWRSPDAARIRAAAARATCRQE